MGMMVLVPEGERVESAGTLTLSCGTDNQGNSFLLDRMMTTKYPLVVILMELAHQMRRRRLVLRARWLPRLENEEADALTNLDFRHFDAAKRAGVSWTLLAAAEAKLQEAQGKASREGLAKDRKALETAASSTVLLKISMAWGTRRYS